MEVHVKFGPETSVISNMDFDPFQVKTADLLEQMTPASYSEALPHGTRFIRPVGSSLVMLVEIPPAVHKTTWQRYAKAPFVDHYPDTESYVNAMNEWRNVVGNPRVAYLAFPYIWMGVIAHNYGRRKAVQCMLGYSTREFRSINDPWLQPNLLNVKIGCCTLCTGEAWTGGNLVEIVDSAFDGLFGNAFNNEYKHTGWDYYRETGSDNRIRDLDAWEEASQKDPLFVLDEELWHVAGTAAKVLGIDDDKDLRARINNYLNVLVVSANLHSHGE